MERKPGNDQPAMGEVIPFSLEDRLHAAEQDIEHKAFWELRILGYTNQPLAATRIDSLNGYPRDEMRADLQARYRIGDTDAETIMREGLMAVSDLRDLKYKR